MKSKTDKAVYDMNYQKNHMSRVTVWFNLEKDADLLEWMSRQNISKSELIKNALRQMMAEKGDVK